MPRISLFLLCVLVTCCFAQSLEDSYHGEAQSDPRSRSTSRVAPHEDNLQSQNGVTTGWLRYSETSIVEGTKFHDPLGRNLPQRVLVASPHVKESQFNRSLLTTCSYGNNTYRCSFGPVCRLLDMEPRDLCHGGLYWACCVPSADVPKNPDDNVLDNAECGRTYVRGSRIIGGGAAKFGQFPWQAILKMQPRGYCGGSLINERYVLTAAHCVKKFDKGNLHMIKVLLGINNRIHVPDGYPHAIEYEVEKVIIHQRFRKDVPAYDIALLRLTKPVIFREHIVPICLPQQGDRHDGEIATVSGWGTLKQGENIVPSSLQKLKVQIISNDICRSWLYAQNSWRVHDTMMCAGFEKAGKNMCYGDSGGPLMSINDGRAQVIGIASWVVRCDGPKSPGVYTRVSDYVDWIYENMQQKLYFHFEVAGI